MINKDVHVVRLIREIRKRAQSRSMGFAIANTSDLFENKRYYLTPLRETNTLIYGGAVVRDVATAYEIARYVDGKTDYVFVDAEKKIRKIYYGPDDVGNIERAIRETVTQSKIITYKGNDLCVDAVDRLLEQLVVGLDTFKAGILGVGNVGAKIALRLVERGAHVTVYRRAGDKLKKIIAGLNNIKSANTIAKISMAHSLEDVFSGMDIVIACANEKEIVGKRLLSLMNANGPRILVDVGKGCFDEEAVEEAQCLNIPIYRLDVSVIQRHAFSAFVETSKKFDRAIGRRRIDDGISLISLGLLGRFGEIIVDDITHPTEIIGISDGKGSLISDTSLFKKSLDFAKMFISRGA